MKTRNFICVAVLVGMSLMYLSCIGGSTEIGNARSTITGSLTDNSGAAIGAEMKLVLESFIPGNAEDGKVFTTTTDCFGGYAFEEIPFGEYYLNAKKAGKVLLRGPFSVEHEKEQLDKAELSDPVNLTLKVDTADNFGEVFIKGSAAVYPVISGKVTIESVPSGQITVIALKKADEPPTTLTADNSKSVTMTVSPKTTITTSISNLPPRITTPANGLAFTGIAGEVDYAVDLDAVDAENEKVTFNLVSGPAGMTIDAATGSLAWKPAKTAVAGTYQVMVSATDADGNITQLTWIITLADEKKVIVPSTKIAIKTGSVYLFTVENPDTGTNAYRFSWEDEDTTAWQTSPSISRSWSAVNNTTLSYQTQNRVNGSFSEWSGPMTIVIEGQGGDRPPVITLKGEKTIAIQVGDPEGVLVLYTDFNNRNIVTAADPEGSTVRIDITSDVNKYKANDPATPYTITYTATDAFGNQAVVIRYVNIVADPVIDIEEPIISIGESKIYIALNQSFIDHYAAYDLGDGKDILVSVTGKVDSSKIGEYTLTYTATDSKGNTASVTRVVVVEPSLSIDITPPVITLLGQDTFSLADDQTIDEFKAAWKEPGYTAVDNVDGNITGSVTVSPITYENAFRFIIRYDVKDAVGNVAAEKRRVIKTNDQGLTAPVIVLAFRDSILQVLVGATSWVEPGFAVTDFYDGTIPNSKVTVNDSLLLKNLDHTGGPYKVTYTVINSKGVIGYAQRSVMVVESPEDFTSPVITLKGRNPDTVLVGSGNYVEPGYTALDNRDDDVTPKLTVTGAVDVSLPGEYRRTYTVADLAGNRATMVRTVYVIGNAPGNLPVIYLAKNEQPLEVVPFSGTWNDPGYAAYDAVDGLISKEKIIVYDTALVNNSTKPGTYTITYMVTNSRGFGATASRTVTVLDIIDEPTPPVITLKGRNPDTVLVGSGNYVEPGYTALDNRDGDLTAKVVVTKNIDLTQLGTRSTITYTVSDATGNRVTVVRQVHVVADTTTSDLFLRYLVPSPDPLPSISSAKWYAEQVDGNGPDFDTSNLKYMEFSWNKDSKVFTLNITYVTDPFFKSFSSVTHTFAATEPSLTLVGSEVKLMDAKYYISIIDEKLIWVESNKKFAIIWKKGE